MKNSTSMAAGSNLAAGDNQDHAANADLNAGAANYAAGPAGNTAAGSFQAAGSNQDHAAGADHAGAAGDHLAAGSNQDQETTWQQILTWKQGAATPAAVLAQDAGPCQLADAEAQRAGSLLEEIRVYGINPDDLELDRSIRDLDDQSFMDLAEDQGLVWSLAGFQEDFNDDQLSSGSIFIRFIITRK